MSSVSCVASTAPWPARAWSEWPCVISALSTGRIGSMWKPPSGQHRPAGVGFKNVFRAHDASDMSYRRALLIPEARVTVPLFISSGDLIADRRYDLARGYAARRRSRGRRRPARAGGGDSRPASPRPGSRSAKRARRSATATARGRGVRAGACRRSGGSPRRGAASRAARRAPIRRCRDARTAMCARCSTSTRRASTARSRTSPIAAPALLRDARDGGTARRASATMLDLGCGTGLAGAAFRPHVDWLVGVDLSPTMIAAARAQGPL